MDGVYLRMLGVARPTLPPVISRSTTVPKTFDVETTPRHQIES